MKRADQLFDHVAAGGNGAAAHELLGKFFDGYPLERLRLLLQSGNEEAAKAGAFIASELGMQFAPLIDELQAMLNHRLKNVRFDALDAVLNTVTVEGEILAAAMTLVSDSEEAVRWQAFRFLARATEEQLAAGARCLSDSGMAALTTWLMGLRSARPEEASNEVNSRLDHDDRLNRRFAAVAAVRLATDDDSPLEKAAASTDLEVRQFAQDELQLLELDERRKIDPTVR